MRIIIFDYDGVFVDSLAYCAEVHNKLCTRHNLPSVASPEDFGKRFMRQFAASFHHDGMNEAGVREFMKDMQAEFSRSYHDLPPVDGMRELVMGIKDEMYIVTSNVTDIVERHMREHKISSMIAVLGSDKEFSKIKKIEVIKTRHPGDKVIFITDTVNDIIDGKHTGAIVIAVTWGYHSRQVLEQAKPDYLVDTPVELKELLERL